MMVPDISLEENVQREPCKMNGLALRFKDPREETRNGDDYGEREGTNARARGREIQCVGFKIFEATDGVLLR